MGRLSKWRDDYIVWHANRAQLPTYFEGEHCTQKICFSGRVQNVGFRLELATLEKRLPLTGTVYNLENGDVEAILQGPSTAIHYVIAHMHQLKRAKVKKITSYELSPIAATKFDIGAGT